MRRLVAGIIPVVALATALTAPATDAQAERKWRGRGFHGQHYGYFTPRGHARWRGGYWRHRRYRGRPAWWWIVGGYWHYYPTPIYPYPLYVPPAVVVHPAPPVYSGPPPTQYWSFCGNPRGYYPYVTSCRGAWRPVPVRPPAAPRRTR